MIIPTMPRSSWTQEMDAQLKNAVSQYNDRNPSTPFPEVPFKSHPPFAELKQEYLPDLDKDVKQIRERWINHLSPRIRAVGILKEDREVVRFFCRESPNEWAKVSLRTYEFSKEKQYYPDNTIKNFHFQLVRKDTRLNSSKTSTGKSTGEHSSKKKASERIAKQSIKDSVMESKKRVSEEKHEASPLSIVDLIERVDQEEARLSKRVKQVEKVFKTFQRKESSFSNSIRGITQNIERTPQENTTKNSSSDQELQFSDILGCDALAKLFW